SNDISLHADSDQMGIPAANDLTPHIDFADGSHAVEDPNGTRPNHVAPNVRAIPQYMPWRHPGSCVNDLVPKIGFNPEDVKKLGEFVVKLRNIPMGVLVILGLSRAWWNHRCDPVIREENNVNVAGEGGHSTRCSYNCYTYP
ncbi:hypothetical protein Tco_0160428, partial [Tanacetum coccineum]